jgi:hypothetical protein
MRGPYTVSARERFLDQATQWDRNGLPAASPASGYRLIALQCSLYSRGAEAEDAPVAA